MNKFRFLAPIVFLIAAAGFSTVVMLLWNWLMPSLFGLITISFWQALGILVLCRLLFGGLGSWHHKMHKSHGEGLRNHIREEWMKMTPEERKEFVNRKREHFRRGGFFGKQDFDPFTMGENTSKEHE